MTKEYARHNGHTDLIRELTDGAVGAGRRKSSRQTLDRSATSRAARGAAYGPDNRGPLGTTPNPATWVAAAHLDADQEEHGGASR